MVGILLFGLVASFSRANHVNATFLNDWLECLSKLAEVLAVLSQMEQLFK